MQVSASEGVANHTVPESCAETREGFGEALTGVRIGWVLSRENNTLGTPTLCVEWKAHGRARQRERLAGPARS